MFTFLTITYNHEKYIIEHLESIKYQIENYGNNNQFQFVLSDDSSQDKTIELVHKWININKKLFSNIEILTSDENQGVVKNYLKGIDAVDNCKYKILAGDDLYYKNNIFQALGNYDLVFTPTIKFDKTINMNVNDFHMFLLIKNKTVHKIQKMIKYENIFDAPGVLIKSELIKDKQLKSFISQYKWIEDLPQWYYLFNKIENLNCCVKQIPYVLYRSSSGISSNKKHQKNSSFTIEQELIRNQLNMKLNKYPKYINPYRYYWKLVHMKLKYFDSKFNSEIVEFKKVLEKEIKEAPEYLNYLRMKSQEFSRTITEDAY